MTDQENSSLLAYPLKGVEYIKDFTSRLTTQSGVYRMIDAQGEVLYVGKAKNLKNRVTNYTNSAALSARIMRMVAQTVQMEVIVTKSEAEALLLEANLIKKYQPRYNILLKDDKSYPYIRLTDHEFPRIIKHRGAQKKGEIYFGPFASASAVTETIALLQKAFLLRPCSDMVFKHRTRPCLQYQIKRCSAPCVNYITKEEYHQLMLQAELFLKGKTRVVQEELAKEMMAHSEAMHYEKAAQYRDRIRILTQIQQQQRYHEANIGDADVIACHNEFGMACVQIWFFRGGQHFGNHAYFPANAQEEDKASILALFMGQYYQTHPVPKRILLESEPHEMLVLQEALSLLAKYKVECIIPKRGANKALVEEVRLAASEALAVKVAERRSETKHLQAIQALFGLPHLPTRIEVYDNSHIAGTHAVGAMIVATEQGFEPSEYRRFNFRNTELVGGDDYAMMREMLTRRMQRIQAEDPRRVKPTTPRLLLIDGGKGQMSAVQHVMEKLQISDIPFVCIAKGEDRNAGREQFFMPGREPFQLPVGDPTLHYLQRLRDEAHRFAITSHRVKRANAVKASALDDIAGIGGQRKRALIMHFGSAKAVAEASISELQQVKGINAGIAKQIYDHYHE
jgi:excinuclease ABC subunit C